MFRRRPRSGPVSGPVSGAAAAPNRAAREARGATEVLPTIGLVEQLLDEFGLRHTIDPDGDLLVRWERCSIYFFFYGENDEVLQARLYLNRRFDVDDRGAITVLLDEWNRTRLFGKAYTILPDDGMVAICAEECHDFEGATRSQIKHAVATWIDTLLRFADWVDEQL